MDWLFLFGAIAIVVGAVVWLAGRAARRRRPEPDVDDDAGDRPGPRHVDVAAIDLDGPDDASP